MTPESDLKKKIKDFLDDRGAFWSMVTGGAYSKPGDPDMVVCYKGHYIAIEAKAPNGVQSPEQKTRQKQIEKTHGIYILAYSVRDVERELNSIDSGLYG